MAQFGKEGDGTASTKCDGFSHHFFNDSMLELLSIRNGVLTPLRRLSDSVFARMGIFRDAANERPGGGASEQEEAGEGNGNGPAKLGGQPGGGHWGDEAAEIAPSVHNSGRSATGGASVICGLGPENPLAQAQCPQ